MDGSSILGAMQALQFGAQATNGILALKVGSEVQAKAIELNTQIIAAQGHVMAMQQEYSQALEEVKTLKETIKRLEGIGELKSRYQLSKIASGAYAYVLTPEAEANEEPHWLCVSCFENGFRSILQFQRLTPDRGSSEHGCPRCKTKVVTHWSAKPKLLSAAETSEEP